MIQGNGLKKEFNNTGLKVMKLSMNSIFLLDNHPIRTLHAINEVFLLDEFGVLKNIINMRPGSGCSTCS
jgi:hypothetical protein